MMYFQGKHLPLLWLGSKISMVSSKSLLATLAAVVKRRAIRLALMMAAA